ncbi:ABC-2 type transport system permease protein [Kineococcus xinjiangensis]|uniref:ABC-2 type transport system permease protein n=1 Tax=Kineococcus xinjiangensis TaxID=512762 RepID=A0A2S6IUL9_9ACTN|nr:ABC transporter permease [Kineococcus xinjiangensis]PPK97961.1 ABC-2 type transport system permease protein [Kineococcus xinjiangensis]
MTATTTAATPAAPGADLRGLWRLVARREVSVRLRDKGFVVSTVLLLLIVLASMFLPPLLAGGPDRYEVAVTARTAPLLAAPGADGGAAAGTEGTVVVAREVADAAAAEALVRDGAVDAALLPGASARAEIVGGTSVPQGLLEVLTERVAAQQLVSGLVEAGVPPQRVGELLATPPPATRLLDPDAVDPVTAMLLGIAFAVLFFQVVLIFGFSIAQSVVQEKQTRVIELLVTAVPVRQLLVGKIVGNGLLAFGQMALLVGVGLAGFALSDREALASLPSLPLAAGWFLVFFVFGFAMLSCLWAAAGAMASRLEDLQSTATPVQFLVMIPFFAAVFVRDPGPVLTALSYVPLSSPLVMPRRVLAGDAAVWEPFAALALIVVTALVLVVVARRLYENSLLQTGRTLGFRAAWRRPV